MKMRICHFRMQSYEIMRHKPSAYKEKVEINENEESAVEIIDG